MENKFKRDDLLVASQIEALASLINAKVAYPKFTLEKVGGQTVKKPTGSFEATPFDEKELSYLKACAISLVSQSIEKGELLKPVENTDEAQTKLELETNE